MRIAMQLYLEAELQVWHNVIGIKQQKQLFRRFFTVSRFRYC